MMPEEDRDEEAVPGLGAFLVRERERRPGIGRGEEKQKGRRMSVE